MGMMIGFEHTPERLCAKQGSRGVPPNSNEGRKRVPHGTGSSSVVYTLLRIGAQMFVVHSCSNEQRNKVLNSRLCYKIISGRSIVATADNTL